MLLHVSILRSSSGSTCCSLLKLYVKRLITLSDVSVTRQHIVCMCICCTSRREVDRPTSLQEIQHTECPGGNVPDFGRIVLKLKYTDLTKNTHIRSWTITEIMTREAWKYDSCYTLIDYQIHIKTGRNMWFL